MATGYVRQSTGSIVPGNSVRAVHFNNEFDAIQAAFHATTGHTHDGTAGGGAQIALANTSGTLAVARGGTGATTADAALTSLGGTATGTAVFKATDAAAGRTALGLGTVATESTVPVAKGGTGATTADTALTNLGGTTVGKNVFKAADAATARTAISAASNSHNHDSTYLPKTNPQLTSTLDVNGNDLTNIGSATANQLNLGTIAASGTAAVDVTANLKQKVTISGAVTFNLTGFTSGKYSEVEIELVNGGLGTIGFQVGGVAATVNWYIGDGTTSTTFSDTGVTLNSAGTNVMVIWSTDGGTTLYGVAK